MKKCVSPSHSLKILDELGMSHDMTIVTDGFHQYRASLIAKAQGVENVTAYSAYTEPRYLFTYWVREWLGLTHFFMQIVFHCQGFTYFLIITLAT